VKEEVLSNRSLNIAIWDVLGIIRCPRNGIFFPWEILPLNVPYEPICHLGFIASLRFDVLAVRCHIGSTPSLMQVLQFSSNIAPKEAAPKDDAESTERNAAADEQHQERVQQLEEQVAGGMARRAALAANTQTEERAKTEELERALELLCQQEEELNQRLLEASTAVATALEKTPAAADQVLPCLGDAFNICLHGRSFVWTVKQQEDHVRFFGAAGPRPARCSACRQRWKKRKKWK
jgi:hypothetical protein